MFECQYGMEYKRYIQFIMEKPHVSTYNSAFAQPYKTNTKHVETKWF